MGVLEAGVDLGVGVGDFFECAAAVRTAPWGRLFFTVVFFEYVEVDVVKGPATRVGVLECGKICASKLSGNARRPAY